MKDFRRGHAQDLLDNGARLCTIPRAGEWRSAAFANYLDTQALDEKAVLEAHLNMSSDDEGFSGDPQHLD